MQNVVLIKVNPSIARKRAIQVERHSRYIGMEPPCPLYFPLYPHTRLLPGLHEYLADTTPLIVAALDHREPIDSSDRWRKTSNSGSSRPLVVGSRKLVFLHSTPSKWCRIKRLGRARGAKEEVTERGSWSTGNETENETKNQTGNETENQTTARDTAGVDGGVLVGSILHWI